LSELSEELRDQAAAIRLLILDVDGVLTDGSLLYGPEGEQLKQFDVKDGLGIRLLLDHGVQVAVITARKSAALERRMADLGIEQFFSGSPDKLQVYERLRDQLGLKDTQVAYMGDDILDLPVMRKVGLSIAVADAHDLVIDEAKLITEIPGGCGAVREVADGLLAARGDLKTLCDAYLARRGDLRPLETA